jgi:hypothetical protein
VIIFSTVFPKYHPKSGQPTFFKEKIMSWLVHEFPEKHDDWIFVENSFQFPKPFKGQIICWTNAVDYF